MNSNEDNFNYGKNKFNLWQLIKNLHEKNFSHEDMETKILAEIIEQKWHIQIMHDDKECRRLMECKKLNPLKKIVKLKVRMLEIATAMYNDWLNSATNKKNEYELTLIFVADSILSLFFAHELSTLIEMSIKSYTNSHKYNSKSPQSVH